MIDVNQSEVADAQREVQRLLGRCLLRVQQYEKLLKHLIAEQAISGTPETIHRNMDARRAEAAGLTLGVLVGRLLGDYIQKEGSDAPEEAPDQNQGSHFSFRLQVHLPDESYEALKADLRALVTLRNSLVHHFIEQHDIQTLDGCLLAQAELHRSYAEIDRRVEQLRTFADEFNQTRKEAAKLMASPEYIEAVVNGIMPDGQVHWPGAGIVYVLRRAFRELSVDGWANLEVAARWVAEQEPEQTPKKYGCSSWRQAVHESGQFELCNFTHNGQSGRWYREKRGAR